jgi:hypothetical protein
MSLPLHSTRPQGPPALAEGARQFSRTTTSGNLRSVWHAAPAAQWRGAVEIGHHGAFPGAGRSRSISSSTPFDPADMRAQLPGGLAPAEAGPWTPPESAKEVGAALIEADSAFKAVLDQPGADQWLKQLTSAMAERGRSLSETAKGLKLTFCFPAAYGSVRHVALATIWREPNSRELRVAVLHQESLPRVDDGVVTFMGRVYDSFDTSSDYPRGIAPVVESMRLAGPPLVNVFPCERPQDLPGATLALRRVLGDHPYGPNEKWAPVPAALHGKPFATCFTITDLGLKATSDQVLKISGEPTLPDTFSSLAPLVSTDVSRYGAIKLREGTATLEQFGELTPAGAREMMVLVGKSWGDERPWDAQSIYTVTSARAELSEGRVTVADAPDVHAVKFAVRPRGIELDGEPVEGGVAYKAAEVRRMTVAAAPDEKVKVVYDIARARDSTPHGKL